MQCTRTYSILARGYFRFDIFFSFLSAVAVVADTPLELLILIQHPGACVQVAQPLLLARDSQIGTFYEINDRCRASVDVPSGYVNVYQNQEGNFRTHFTYEGQVRPSTGAYTYHNVSDDLYADFRSIMLKLETGNLWYGALELGRGSFLNPQLVDTSTYTQSGLPYQQFWAVSWLDKAGTGGGTHPFSGHDVLVFNHDGSSSGYISSPATYIETTELFLPYVAVYYAPMSSGFTREMLAQMPWGWWGQTENFITSHNGYYIEGYNGPFADNPAFHPPNPTNPYTGRPFLDSEVNWKYDESTGRWVSYNRYLDPTSPPTTPLGNDGQWMFGKNPNGNKINTQEGGLEWYWTGTVDPNSPGMTDGGYSSPTGGGSASSTAALNLLQQIANNTGQTLSQTMGISSAIQGLRGDINNNHTAYMNFVSDSRASLFNMLHNHNDQVQMSLGNIGGSLSSMNDLLSAMSPVLSGIYGNTTSIDNKMSVANNYLSSMNSSLSAINSSTTSMDSRLGTANDFLSSINSSASSVDAKFTTANTRLELINGELQYQTQSLQQMQSLFETAVAGSDRIEGHIVDIKTILPGFSTEVTLSACKEALQGMLRNFEQARGDTEKFRAELADYFFKEQHPFAEKWDAFTDSYWTDKADEKIRELQSLEYLQKMVDLTDSMEQYFRLEWDPQQDALWWRVERIRWVQRQEQDTENLSAVNENTQQISDNTAQINEQMERLINEVVNIPPPETPTIDLSEIESALQQLVQKQNETTDLSNVESTLSQIAQNTTSGQGQEQGPDLSLIEDSLEVIKQRLQSIDRAVSGQVDVPTFGAVELDPVQKNFAGEANKIKDFHSQMSALDELGFGFQIAWLGRSGNPVWFQYELNLLDYCKVDYSIDFTDEKWNWFTAFLPFIKALERFFIWVTCLIMCMRFAVKVNG